MLGQRGVDKPQALGAIGDRRGSAQIGLLAQYNEQLLAIETGLAGEEVDQPTDEPGSGEGAQRQPSARHATQPRSDCPECQAKAKGDQKACKGRPKRQAHLEFANAKEKLVGVEQ